MSGMGAMPAKPMAGMDMGAKPMGMKPMQGMNMTAMPGMAMDLNDVEYDAFLANDRTLADPEIVRVEPGGRVLLRIINGAAASNFVIDLGKLKGELVAVDGHAVQPLGGSNFPV